MNDLWNTILNSFEFKAIIRMILAVILCAFIGKERESYKKPAGLRTHILMGISACMVMLLGLYISDKNPNSDAGRIPGQLLSGIGFIGAGTIITNGMKVKGLTTAASILASTAIELLCGAGAYVIAIFATLIVYGVLSYTHLFAKGAEKYESFELIIHSKDAGNKVLYEEIESTVESEGALIRNKVIDSNTIKINGIIKDEDLTKKELIDNIVNIDGIDEVHEVNKK